MSYAFFLLIMLLTQGKYICAGGGTIHSFALNGHDLDPNPNPAVDATANTSGQIESRHFLL